MIQKEEDKKEWLRRLKFRRVHKKNKKKKKKEKKKRTAVKHWEKADEKILMPKFSWRKWMVSYHLCGIWHWIRFFFSVVQYEVSSFNRWLWDQHTGLERKQWQWNKSVVCLLFLWSVGITVLQHSRHGQLVAQLFPNQMSVSKSSTGVSRCGISICDNISRCFAEWWVAWCHEGQRNPVCAISYSDRLQWQKGDIIG